MKFSVLKKCHSLIQQGLTLFQILPGGAVKPGTSGAVPTQTKRLKMGVDEPLVSKSVGNSFHDIFSSFDNSAVSRWSFNRPYVVFCARPIFRIHCIVSLVLFFPLIHI